MRYLTIFLVILSPLITGKVSAQIRKSDNVKPQWIHTLPQPSNSTFTYELDPSVIGKTLEEARKTSLNGMITSAGFENGVVVVSDYQSKVADSKIFKNGNIYDSEEDIFVANNKIQGKDVQLNLKRVAEYWEQDENGNYHLTTLYMQSLNKNPWFDDVEVTTKYGLKGLWRSAIVPGWGQLYKGSTLKGGLIMVGSVVFIGGIIYTETLRKDYMNKISKTHNSDNIREYKRRADGFATARNICIAGLGALYVYNVIDAIVAPGAKRIVTHKTANGGGISLLPSINQDYSPALTATFVF